MKLSKNQAHAYWSDPDEANIPERYIPGKRSNLIVYTMDMFADRDDEILEIGCNVGRNLNALLNNGFMNLHGIELNRNCERIMAAEFPKVRDLVDIQWGLLEEAEFPKVDIIYSMAVLCHVHYDSDFIMDKISAAAGKMIITMEAEGVNNERHYPRNYKDKFEMRGWEQVGEMHLDGVYEFTRSYYWRVFKR